MWHSLPRNWSSRIYQLTQHKEFHWVHSHSRRNSYYVNHVLWVDIIFCALLIISIRWHLLILCTCQYMGRFNVPKCTVGLLWSRDSSAEMSSCCYRYRTDLYAVCDKLFRIVFPHKCVGSGLCWIEKFRKVLTRALRVGSEVVKIDPLLFLAWCCTRQLNQV